MNICLLNLDYVPYRTAGLTIYGELLAGGLHAAGHAVTMIAAQRQGAPPAEVIEGVQVIRVPIGRTDWVGLGWQGARKVHELVRTRRFDIVHFLDVRFAWAYRGDCLATLFESFWQRLHAKGNLPYSSNLANLAWRYVYFTLINCTLQEWAASRPRAMIAASQAARDAFIDHYSVPGERITVVPLGIDTTRYYHRDSSNLRSALGLQGKRVILYVGFSTPRKGLEYVGQALSELGPECRLLIVGKWERGYRERFYRDLPPGSQERIIEAGYVPDEDLPFYYSLADVFVFPSLLEGFGLPPVEAMACGTPVVAANTSSLPEVVGDAGLLVPPMDAPALAAALQRLLADETLRYDLGNRGRERVQRLYTQEQMVTRTVQVYRAFLAARGNPS